MCSNYIPFSDNNEKMFHLFFSYAILNDFENLYQHLTQAPVPVNTLPAERLNSFNTYKDSVRNSLEARKILYKQELDVAMKKFVDNEGIIEEYKPFSDSVDRIFNYELMNDPSNDDKVRLLNILYITKNWESDKDTFNGKTKLT